MDLRSVLNTSDNGDRAPSKPAPTPQKQQQQQQQQQQPPPRPGQSPAQYGYRDYGHQPPQPSPGKPAAHDYPHPPQHHASNAYPAPSPYQSPAQYPPRPAPPPLQPPNLFHDGRSPGGSRTNSAPIASPYRPSPSTASLGDSPGYPFPHTQPAQEIASPVQRHQYPPSTQYQHQRRDSYSQSPGVAAPAHASAPYVQQQQHAVPQTMPIGASSHPYLHQRSQSTHSTPTSTSTPGQHQYGPSYAQGSPILAAQPPPSEYNRHPSQPPTPLAAPQQTAPRQPSAPSNFAHPPSPYQQRMQSTGVAPTQPSPKPAPPPPPAHRLSNARSTYESPVSDINQRPPSRQEREQSLSVSPRTRVGSIPSNPDRTSAPSDTDSRPCLGLQSMAIDSDRAVTPAKRKLEDRSMSPRELEHREAKPPPGEVNGGYADRIRSSESPAAPTMKRVRRAEPPTWAQSAHTLGKKLPTHANFVLQKRAHSHIHAPVVNGKPESTVKAERASRNASPETTRPRHHSLGQAPPPAEPGPQDQLGPWEASITGVKPFEELSKTVADFLFIHVINNQDMQEILSRGIQFEIEAKLGTLIDRDTNHRLDRSIDSECIVQDNGRSAFRSSMTEAHHKAFNEFLNSIVLQTDPRHSTGRVQVHYKHRRERDRFFELPPELHGHIPACVRTRLGNRSRNARVRVTYDQKTGQVLNKIIKARIADISLHLPMCPMDCRISVNLEMNWDGAVEELEQSAQNQGERQPDRIKDRLSYTQGHYQVDLTQVTYAASGPGGSQRAEKEHELEIELAPSILIEQGRRAISGAPHRYQELVEGLVDNVRVFARKARDFTKA